MTKRVKKYNFTYQTKNLVNGKTYIGFHCTNNLNDGYIGCGVRSQASARGYKKYGNKSAFIDAVNKYGYHNFKREILCFFDTREEAVEEEMFLVNVDWVNNPKNYNISLGGNGGNPSLFTTTEEQDEQIFKMFMQGVSKKDIAKKFNISTSVIWRITKNRDTSTRVKKLSKKSIKILKWIYKNKEKYINLYKNHEMSWEDISKICPFDLGKNNFLKNIDKNPKYYVILNNIPRSFTTSKELFKLIKIRIHRSHFIPATKGVYSHAKGFVFYCKEDYDKGYRHPIKNKGRKNPVICNSSGKIFYNPAECANHFNLHKDTIYRILNNKYKANTKINIKYYDSKE